MAVDTRAVLVEPCEIGKYSYVREYTHISQNVRIGKYCSIGNLCTIGAQHHNIDGLTTWPMTGARNDETVIGNDVWIGCNVVVLAGVRVGDGAVIGAGSVVTRDIPSYAIAYGNPARVKRFRFQTKIIADLLDVRWWDLPLEAVRGLPLRDAAECIKAIRKMRGE